MAGTVYCPKYGDRGAAETHRIGRKELDQLILVRSRRS
jgi:hypothetical protein